MDRAYHWVFRYTKNKYSTFVTKTHLKLNRNHSKTAVDDCCLFQSEEKWHITKQNFNVL